MEQKQTQKLIQRFNPVYLGAGILIVALLATSLVTLRLYNHTVNLLTNNLRERLTSIALTQAANLDPVEVAALRVEEDWKKPEWARVVNRLKAAKESHSDIVYIYIYRKTPGDPSKLEFVSDAGSINPYANHDDDPTNDVDNNRDGLIEPEEADYLQWPGQEYPDPPEEAFEAYAGPMTSRELYEDDWGRVLTGYAPIYDASSEVIAVLAIDIKADDFFVITQQTLYPFVIFVVFLVAVLLVLAVLLILIWNARVKMLQQLDRQKDELLGIVSHQLASPLASMQWTIEGVCDGDFGPISEQANVELGKSHATAGELAQTAAMLLEVSRIQLGRLQMNKEEQSLQAFFNRLLPTIEKAAKAKNVRLDVSLPKALPNGSFDSRLTRMTIENLLTNAVKYTPENGTVTLEVKMKGRELQVKVKDTGIGIPKQDQDKMFGKLWRASNVGKIGGNGFGLYVAKGAIEQQGGTIRFKSTENKGTTFYVTLPV